MNCIYCDSTLEVMHSYRSICNNCNILFGTDPTYDYFTLIIFPIANNGPAIYLHLINEEIIIFCKYEIVFKMNRLVWLFPDMAQDWAQKCIKLKVFS